MLVRAAKVSAGLDGRLNITPADIAAVFHPVVAHRVFFPPFTSYREIGLAKAYTQAILRQVPTA